MNKKELFENRLISLWNYLDIDCCDDLSEIPFYVKTSIIFMNEVGRK